MIRNKKYNAVIIHQYYTGEHTSTFDIYDGDNKVVSVYMCKGTAVLTHHEYSGKIFSSASEFLQDITDRINGRPIEIESQAMLEIMTVFNGVSYTQLNSIKDITLSFV